MVRMGNVGYIVAKDRVKELIDNTRRVETVMSKGLMNDQWHAGYICGLQTAFEVLFKVNFPKEIKEER